MEGRGEGVEGRWEGGVRGRKAGGREGLRGEEGHRWKGRGGGQVEEGGRERCHSVNSGDMCQVE